MCIYCQKEKYTIRKTISDIEELFSFLLRSMLFGAIGGTNRNEVFIIEVQEFLY
jgi:hypothetical protein